LFMFLGMRNSRNLCAALQDNVILICRAKNRKGTQ
jgi:hypothetical protein